MSEGVGEGGREGGREGGGEWLFGKKVRRRKEEMGEGEGSKSVSK